jgi:hypothetical protein
MATGHEHPESAEELILGSDFMVSNSETTFTLLHSDGGFHSFLRTCSFKRMAFYLALWA